MSYVSDNWDNWDSKHQDLFIDCMKLSLSEIDPGGQWQQWSLYQRWLGETRVWLVMTEPLTGLEAYELAIALHSYLEDLFIDF